MKITAQVQRLATSVQRLVIAVFLFSILYFIFAISSAHAYSSTSETETIVGKDQQSFDSVLNTNSDVPKNLHSVAQIVLLETMSAMACQLAGFDPLTPE